MTELLGGEEPLTPVQFWSAAAVGRDREDKPDYKVRSVGGALLLQ